MTDPEPIWPEEYLDDPHGRPDKATRVRAMFDLIAPRYELANTIISLGLSKCARRKLLGHIRQRVSRPLRILDLCAGPGTLSRILATRYADAEVVAVDFSLNMLRTARTQRLIPNHGLVCADALDLPFADETFDLVTCVYGLRNFQDLDRGLGEAVRVLKNGGMFAALDFQMPRNRAFRSLFRVYFDRVLPVVGSLITGSRGQNAYKYLTSSVASWYDRAELVGLLRRAGLNRPGLGRVGPGVIVLLSGVK